MKYNQDIWRAVEEKVKAEIAAAATGTGAVKTAIDAAITAAVGEGGAVTQAIATHAALTTGVHGLT